MAGKYNALGTATDFMGVNLSYYVWGSGISYVDYLQAKSFVDDVSSASRGVSLEVSRQTRELVASNKDLTRGNIRIGDAVSEGFDRLSWALGEISSELGELNATFHWGFSQVIAQFGHMNDTLAELVSIAKTPVQTTAYNHFEIARDAFRQALYQECLEELNIAINGDHTSAGYRLEWRFHQMLGTVRLGFVDGDPTLINLDQAEQSFLLAARYASADYQEEAARAFLSAGWSAYCQGKMDQALTHTEEAIKLLPNMGEALFQAAKILMAKGEADKSIAFLRRVVYEDPNYLIKAASDGDFQNHNNELLGLVGTLRQEAHAEAEKAIAPVQSIVNEMEEWHTAENASSQTGSALALLAEAQESFRSASYFGYLYAQDFVQQFLEMAQLAIKTQKDHMVEVIEKLKSQAGQLWGYFDTSGQWRGGGGDIDIYQLKRYAPNLWRELGSAIDEAQVAWNLENREGVTYPSYQRTADSLRQCLTLGSSAAREELLSKPVEIPFQVNSGSVRRSRHLVDLATL